LIFSPDRYCGTSSEEKATLARDRKHKEKRAGLTTDSFDFHSAFHILPS
jgi:hypothetical protein